jgi:anti-sigma factor RsiW
VTYAEGGSGSVGPDYGRLGGRAASVEIAELTHDEIRGQLSEYLADALDEAQTSRIAAHLRQCAACAAYLATLRATVNLLGALPTKTAPESLRRRLLAIPDDDPAAPA